MAEITFEQARELLTAHRIVRIVRHPAAYEFHLPHATVRLYPGGHDWPDGWELEPPDDV